MTTFLIKQLSEDALDGHGQEELNLIDLLATIATYFGLFSINPRPSTMWRYMKN